MGCGSSKEVDQVEQLLKKSRAPSTEQQAAALQLLADLAEAHDPLTGMKKDDKSLEYQDYVVQLGGLERCHELHTSSTVAVRQAVARLLLNLSFNVKSNKALLLPPVMRVDSKPTKPYTDACGVAMFIALIKDVNDDVRCSALWSFVNLLVNPETHYIIETPAIQQSLFPILAERLGAAYESNTRFWALRVVCNLCLGSGETQINLAQTGILINIFDILNNIQPANKESSDNRMKFFGLACLSNLTSKNSVVENMIVDQGGLPVIFALLKSEYPNIPAEAAKVITNLAVQNEKNQEKIVEAGGVTLLLPLVFNDSDDIQFQAACALLNIAQNEKIRYALMSDDGIVAVAHLLSSDRDVIQRKAAAIITVLAETENDKQKLIEKSNVCERLETLSNSTNITSMESLMARVRAAQALAKLKNDDIYYKKTLLNAIADVLNKYTLASTFEVIEWRKSYDSCSVRSRVEDIVAVFTTFIGIIQEQAHSGLLHFGTS